MDLQGPLDDFLRRTAQIRLAVHVVERASKDLCGLTAKRPKTDFQEISGATENTVNSMSLVFLASSYEEFVREEIGQCADYLSQQYARFAAEVQINIRGAYWGVWLDRAKSIRSIADKSKKNKVADTKSISVMRKMLGSASGFVVDADPSLYERENFFHHTRNFRPAVVDELAHRLGINNLMVEVGEQSPVKNYFGVSKKSEASVLLRAKLDEFYNRRNEIVHSLSTSSGYAADVVFDYIDLFEATADGIRGALARITKQW